MSAQPYFTAGRYSEAIGALNRCLALAPDFSPGYNLRGKAHAILGHPAAALADFSKVISLSPSMAEGYRNSGFIYLLQNDPKMAEKYLVKALSLSPNDPKTRRALDALRPK